MPEITVVTCDKNVDIVRKFYTCFVAAWPGCPYPVTIVGNTRMPLLPKPNPNWRSFLSGPDRGWASTVLSYVRDNMHRGPFLILLEDYLLKQVRFAERIDAAFREAALPEVGMVRLNPCPGPTIDLPPDSGLTPREGWGVLDPQCRYALSLQPAIWDGEVILRLFREGNDAWQTEIHGSRRAAVLGDTLPTFFSSTTTLLPYQNYLRHGRKVAEVEHWYSSTFG